MIRVVAADDEPLALKRLVRALEDMADVRVVGVAADGDAALREIETSTPDVAILDIRMPGLDGLAVAAAQPSDRPVEIVFLTAFDHYAADAFAVEAVDYLLKPVRPERLRQAVERAVRRRAGRLAADRADSVSVGVAAPHEEVLRLHDRSGGRDIPQCEIVWVEAAKDYAVIYTPLRTHILRTTMAELAQRLHPTILRTHRSAFVAAWAVRRRIRSERGLYTLLLSDGSKVQVGPSYAKSIRASLLSLRPDLD